MKRIAIALSVGALLLGAVSSGSALAKHNPGHGKGKKHGTPSVSVFAARLNKSPRADLRGGHDL